MVISEIRIRKMNEECGRLKGIASICLDGMFAIEDIKIIKTKKGMLLTMPGAGKDVAHPLTQETRKVLENLIIPAYSELVLHDWDYVHFTLKDEYRYCDFLELSYEFYDTSKIMIFIPEKTELIQIA